MLDVFESFLKENFSADDNTVASVFRAFDQDNDQVLNREEFELFIQQLFQKTAHIYNLTAQQVEDVRYLLDLTQVSCDFCSIVAMKRCRFNAKFLEIYFSVDESKLS